jgi:hypothetical protein
MLYKITNHAVQRFVERSKHNGRLDVIKKPRRIIRRLLINAKEVRGNETRRMRRLIDNNFISVKYLIINGWRFVVTNKDNIVVTVERINQLEN